MSPAPLLEVADLTIRFGGLAAIDGLSFTAAPGAITAVIGPNGAGKTTLFNCITGFYRPHAGRMLLRHPDGGEWALERMRDHAIASRARVGRTFQNIRLFPRMTVLENLIVAQHRVLMRASLFSLAGLLGLGRYRRAEREALDLARAWLDRTGLLAQAETEAGSLPYGLQRRLEIARAMCTRPVLLCLDEPAAGLNPHESADLNLLLRRIRDEEGIGLLLIEHDMSVVMGISDRVVVLDHGSLIAEGSPAEIRGNPAVIRAYLGEPDADDAAAAGARP
ncbi:MAG: Lipopolysaccharide export system ATP-binding protein LptB [Pseudomonadota bacterium]|jgi:branched-chain amino acid transport system ATP-binding protein